MWRMTFLLRTGVAASEHSTAEYVRGRWFCREPHGPSLTVVFTTIPATLEALKKGAHLARQLGANIRILVPSVVPYPLNVDKPRVSPEFRLRHFRTFCEKQPIDTSIDVRLCRDAGQCVEDGLSPHSVVLIGGRKTWWPLAPEKFMARRMRKHGHEVILVEHEARTA